MKLGDTLSQNEKEQHMKQSVNSFEVHRKTHSMTVVALFTAFVCVLAPLALPIGSVPISFGNLALFLSLYLIGRRRGMMSCLMYLIIGTFGMPVFAGFSGGIGILMGPTGGYLLGYFPMLLVAGFFIERFRRKLFHVIGLLLGCAACYLFGTIWYCFISTINVQQAVVLCVLPFIPVDILKIILISVVGPALQKRLKMIKCFDWSWPDCYRS